MGMHSLGSPRNWYAATTGACQRLGGAALRNRRRRIAARRRTRPAVAAVPSAAESEASQLARVAAALLLAREPITTRKLAQAADLADATRARTLVAKLAEQLRRRGSAMLPYEVAGGVQLLTQPRLADWLARLLGPAEEPPLSPSALETLAVVAYRQPVLRAEVESVRGVQCGELLRMLMERDFLRIVGRADELGRPYLYGTTRKFLLVFGLRRLEDLPPIDQTRSSPANEASAA